MRRPGREMKDCLIKGYDGGGETGVEERGGIGARREGEEEGGGVGMEGRQGGKGDVGVQGGK